MAEAPLYRECLVAQRYQIKVAGDQDNQLALYFICKLDDQGYFPLVCKRTKGLKEVSGQFLYDSFQDGKRLPNSVWLYLKQPMKIDTNALFFIKEIDSAKSLYELKFLFRQPRSNHTVSQHIVAEITNLYRPVLKDKRVAFRDFTKTARQRSSLSVVKVGHGGLAKKQRLLQKKREERSSQVASGNQDTVNVVATVPSGTSREVICKFCGKRFPMLGFRQAHKKQCLHTPIRCTFCNKLIERHNYSIHVESQCRMKNTL